MLALSFNKLVLFYIENPEEKDDNKPIYQGARLTVAATVPLKSKLPPLVSFLARRESRLSRRDSRLSRRDSRLERRDSRLARTIEA